MATHIWRASTISCSKGLFCPVLMLVLFCLLLNIWDFRNSWMIRYFFHFSPRCFITVQKEPSVEQPGSIITATKKSVLIQLLLGVESRKLREVLIVVCFINILFDRAASFWFLGKVIDLLTFKMPFALFLRLLKLCFGCYIVCLRVDMYTQGGITWIFCSGPARGTDSRQAAVSSLTSLFLDWSLCDWLQPWLEGLKFKDNEVFYYEDFHFYFTVWYCERNKSNLVLFVGVLPRLKLE